MLDRHSSLVIHLRAEELNVDGDKGGITCADTQGNVPPRSVGVGTIKSQQMPPSAFVSTNSEKGDM